MMKLNKDKTAVIVNDTLTLAGIPKEAFDYRLGDRPVSGDDGQAQRHHERPEPR
jgi:predicted helicase